jgi:hypothetical protein
MERALLAMLTKAVRQKPLTAHGSRLTAYGVTTTVPVIEGWSMQ